MRSSPSVLDRSSVLLIGDVEWVERFAVTLETRTDARVYTTETETEALTVFRNEALDSDINEVGVARGVLYTVAIY